MTTNDLRPPAVRAVLNRVPEVTVWFWVIKVLTTGMGEAAADWMAHTLGPGPTIVLSGGGLAATMAAQFAVRRHVAGVYWSAVVMVSVFGTVVADGMRITLGLSYLVDTVILLAVLLAVFVAWYASERTLSIHGITTRRREIFYWSTVMATFALGTAAGDWTAITLGWGFLASGVLFAVVIAVPGISQRFLGLNAIAAFWLAYIVTRPLGASFADWMAVSHERGGLNWGTGQVSLGMLAIIAGLVAYLAVSGQDKFRPVAGR